MLLPKPNYLLASTVIKSLVVAFISLMLGSCSPEFDIRPNELTGNDILLKRDVDDGRQNQTCLINAEVRDLIKLHNQTRQSGARCGRNFMPIAGKLTISCKLTSAAHLHSQYMRQKNELSHRGRGGSSVGHRARAAGYQWQGVAENIASGHTSAEAVYQGWLHSDAHCHNIMNGRYTDIGIARVGNYWTAMFGVKTEN